jgi:predicted hydrocarbon binding protein
MLSDFLKKLLFVRQFSVTDGKVEILGVRNLFVSSDPIFRLQLKFPKEVSAFFRDALKKDAAKYFVHLGASKESFPAVAKGLFELSGLGQFRIVDLDSKGKKAIVEIYGSPVKDYYAENGLRPKAATCAITAGILAGIFSYYFDSDVAAAEKRCSSLGDTCCQFIIKVA